MALTPVYGTGFEPGTLVLEAADYSAGVNLVGVTGASKTGSYGLRVGTWANLTGWARFPAATGGSTVYIGAWVHPSSNWARNDALRIYMATADGTAGLRLNNVHKWDAHVGGAWVANGSRVVPNNWHYVEIYISVANAGGIIQTKIDGIDDINFVGDTQSGAATDPVYLYIYVLNQPVGVFSYVDDLSIGTGDWPHDIRYDALVPDSDDAVQWLRSAGADNYALVDERPASDADFVYTITDGHKDKYTLTDFNAAGKNPLYVMQWCRAKKDVAAAHQLKLVTDDGVESINGAQNLLTTYSYLRRLLTTKPSGGAWTDAALDALKIGQEAVIV